MSEDFKRQDYTRYKKLGKKWRRPRGTQSKMRRKKKGKPKMPNIGYRSPKKERGLIGGKKPIIVHNPKEVDKLKEKNSILIIASGVGKKKRLEIIETAKKKGLEVMNVR